MNIFRLLCIAIITLCSAAAWFVLGAALNLRTVQQGAQTRGMVSEVWGPMMMQAHPSAYFLTPKNEKQNKSFLPAPTGQVKVNLTYDPKKRGLMWYRTYDVEFQAEYQIQNPSPITRTVYVEFPLPASDVSYSQFEFILGNKTTETTTLPKNGKMVEAILLQPHETVSLRVAYKTRGMDLWVYSFTQVERVKNFVLTLNTNFEDYNFPQGTASPTTRSPDLKPKEFTWTYEDVLNAPNIGMEMPRILNAGPVASRMSFFAPVSLVFFFTVLMIMGVVMKINLHPMNYFFLAAGCFAFQLLFSYLVDRMSLYGSFGIAALVSLILVSGYIKAVAGNTLFWVALPAQICYMILFSYSFFFDGYTGLTLTVGAIVTLASLMKFTAKVKWEELFTIPKCRKEKIEPHSVLPK